MRDSDIKEIDCKIIKAQEEMIEIQKSQIIAIRKEFEDYKEMVKKYLSK